jgi:hypothetical protein
MIDIRSIHLRICGARTLVANLRSCRFFEIHLHRFVAVSERAFLIVAREVFYT